MAAGDNKRNYVDLCLEWGVILNGPGHLGPWDETKNLLPRIERWKDIKRFCEDVSDGDIIVLHVGTANVYGVGEVLRDYIWSEAFGDIDGWSQEHIRRVRWL